MVTRYKNKGGGYTVPSSVVNRGGLPSGNVSVSTSGQVSVSSGGGGGGSAPAPTSTPTLPGTSTGTYNPSTGVYTSSAGVQQSMAQAPTGATIVGGIGTKYYGGGGSAPSVTTTTWGISKPAIVASQPATLPGWQSPYTSKPTIYQQPLQAYYDPITRRVIEQSMAKEYAERKGYLSIQVLGEEGKKKIIKSETGLLTPRQTATKQFYEAINKKSEETPTTFVIGGESQKPYLADILGKQPSAYQSAMNVKPYDPTSGYSSEMLYEMEHGNVMAITPEDIALVAGGAIGVAKGFALKAAAVVFHEPIIKYTSAGIDLIVPPSRTGFALGGLPKQVARGAMFAGTLPFTGTAYATQIVEGLVTEPIVTAKGMWQFAKESPYELATMTVAGGIIEESIKTAGTKINIKTIEPTQAMKEAVEPLSRQRATVVLKTEEGGYVLGKTKTGEIISFGGKAEKGETMAQAAARELREETGFKLKDTDLTYIGKNVYPEETFHLYESTITKAQLKDLTPMSDIKSIVEVPAWRAKMMAKVSGQTQLQPVSRLSAYPFGKIRAYEYGMIRKAELGLEPTWLIAETRQGKFVLGTQSRYDIAWKYAKEYDVGGEQLYAHGTPKPSITENFIQQTDKITADFSKRGEQGLYIQPPASAKPIPLEVRKLIGYTGKGEVVPLKTTEKLPFTIPKEDLGYIGLSYMGLGPSKELRFAFAIEKPIPTALLFKEKPGFPIRATKKAMAGIESERLISVGTEIGTAGRYETAFLGLRRTYFQPTKILKAGEKLGDIPKSMLVEYDTGTIYLTPKKILSFSSSTKKRKTKEENIIPKKHKLAPTPIKVNYLYSNEKAISNVINYGYPKRREGRRIQYAGVSYKEPISYKEPSIKYAEPKFPYVQPYRYKQVIAREPYLPKLLPITPPKMPTIFKEYHEPKALRQESKAYSVFLKRGKEFKPIATGLTKGRALRFGSEKAMRTLGRTFSIKAIGTTMEKDIMFNPSEKMFRQFKVKKGKRVPITNMFIQRRGQALSSPEERYAIQAARKGLLM